MLLKDFIKNTKEELLDVYGENEAVSLTQYICSEVLGTKNYTHIVDPKFEIEKGKLALLASIIKRLNENEPIQYILGEAHFYGRKFKVNPWVLIPRQETEILCKIAIEEALRLKRQRSPYGQAASSVKVLDLCTGSGCIAWSVALSAPGVEVTGVDISKEALTVAGKNNFNSEIKTNGAKKVKFIEADVLTPILEEEILKDQIFDILVSNPPYVRVLEKKKMKKNVLDSEPELALFVEDKDPLLYYNAIAIRAKKLLSEKGLGVVEINEAFGEEVAQIFKENSWKTVEIVKDNCSKNRFVVFHNN